MAEAASAPVVEFYFSFRSPFSYLATRQLAPLRAAGARFALKIVRPQALRDPGLFQRAHPLWEPYLRRDAQRVAERLSIPFAWPQPDPVERAPEGGFAHAQPQILKLNRLGVAAAEAGRGAEAVAEIAALIWSGTGDWREDQRIDAALDRAGLDPQALRERVMRDGQTLDAAVLANEAAQHAAGHWGVPLFVFRGEPFFGQDRIADLAWRIGREP